ncbi:MAG: 30S ribosomal protein S6 [Candidatus Dependentiae bacterium ADurb.Bin331]|nr:MAG: 30S ribosomal protein S6 [Candidatus Dependentiae bacterium ADurb.Bin331]
MVRYETLILAVPEITADEASSLEGQLEALVKKAQGTILSFERWGKYRLAFPVWNNDYGVYYLIRFEADGAQNGSIVNEIDSLFKVKYTQVVMRHMTTKLNRSQSLAYYKPESLEDAPSQDVDTFLRDNKMKGLLHTVSSYDVKHQEGGVDEVEEVENND